MKLKEIQVGVPYSKRGNIAHWGVPVTTETLYSFPSYARHSPDYLYSGNGVLVLVSNSHAQAAKGRPENAIKVLKTMKVPEKKGIKELVERLKKEGLTVEIWLPREFQGTLEAVTKEREAERQQENRLRAENEASRQSLEDQFETIGKDLGIDVRSYVNLDKNRVSMSISDWRKLMGRVESLLQSDPLNTGML